MVDADNVDDGDEESWDDSFDSGSSSSSESSSQSSSSETSSQSSEAESSTTNSGYGEWSPSSLIGAESVFRRRIGVNNNNNGNNGNDDDDDGDYNGDYSDNGDSIRKGGYKRQRSRSRSRRNPPYPPNHNRFPTHSGEYHHHRLSNKRPARVSVATVTLVLATITWLYVQVMSGAIGDLSGAPSSLRRHRSKVEELRQERQHRNLTPGEMAKLRQERMEEARKALGSAARTTSGKSLSSSSSWFSGNKRDNMGGEGKKHNPEVLPEGCKHTSWQTMAFPACNDVHEIDLRDSLVTNTGRYVGSGFWRTVWKIRPGDSESPIVLKAMKGEHDFDNRNYDRHRRDALAMERLTGSPNVVSIYGYCSHSVLTEYLGKDMENVMFHSNDDIGSEEYPTRQTPEGRIRLALGAAKGVRDIHQVSGGPIIHADIQPEQFMVGLDGTVKLNDFNRCRFMPSNSTSGLPCTVSIPTAPGSYRSPEEYEFDGVTEKVDVYSLAHVLFGVLTGNKKPWTNIKRATIKMLISNGEKPPIPAESVVTPSDAALAKLIDQAYEVDPNTRISARDLVTALEDILQQHFSANAE